MTQGLRILGDGDGGRSEEVRGKEAKRLACFELERIHYD